MDSSYLTNPLVFLVDVIFGLYALIVMLRFLLQWVRADFYNPLSQFIVKVTSPVLNPLRRVIPGVGGKDVASLILAWLVIALELLLVFAISGQGLQPWASLLLAIPKLVELVINIFLFSILTLVIVSWVSPGNYNPAIGVLNSLTEPLMGPARRMLPPIGGIDLSPMLVMIGLYLLKMLLLPPLQQMLMALI
jgi:YggT family protein